MTYETLLIEHHDAVTLVRLNRPQALNALNSAVLADLIAAFSAFDADASQRCLVLTGSEKAFAAGADIKEMADQSFAAMYGGNFFAGYERVTATRKPWIAAVSGFALGGGCELAMMADILLCADTAKFGQPEIKLGVIPGMGGSQRLIRAIGKAKAMEMCLTGRMMGAAEAEAAGLVARVVPAADLVDEALKTAAAIAGMPPLAAIAAKEAINASFEMSLAQGVNFERRLFHGLFGSADQKEGMAANLAKAGHEVRAFDLSPDAVARAVGHGCTAAPSARAAAHGADAIVTMLPAGSHVATAYGETLFAAASPPAGVAGNGGPILIDCSTIDVATARSVGEAAAEKGLKMVDAPVSGGTAAADAGTLTFMVGGPEAAFEMARPILEKMGKAVIHAGGPGMGQAAKICNNMILGATMVATAEAFVLAEKLGLDAQTFFDISSKASGQSWSMTSYCPVPGPVPASPANRDYQGGFASALMLKDLKLALAAATTAGASVPMGAQAEALYQMFANNGGSAQDFSAIVKFLRG